MTRYRKKPVIVDAMRWSGTNFADILAWAAPRNLVHSTGAENKLLVSGFDGIVMQAKIGDYVLKANDGTITTCPAHIFNIIYEEDD